jgi:hypothetical protein
MLLKAGTSALLVSALEEAKVSKDTVSLLCGQEHIFIRNCG